MHSGSEECLIESTESTVSTVSTKSTVSTGKGRPIIDKGYPNAFFNSAICPPW